MDYAEQTLWSDPGPLRERLTELPVAPRDLADALENFLIHHVAARFLKFGVPEEAEPDRNLRTVEKLLTAAFARDARPLSQQRELSAYLYGSCHDFALLAASVFRFNGIAARLRVGFVDYFRQGRWEDHWLCEYRTDGAWHLLDAQMGRRAREGHGIGFAVESVPRQRFRSGSQLWLDLRAGRVDPDTCGVSFAGISGDWFPAASVLRDAATLAMIEPLPWDYWGPARNFCLTQAVTDDAARDLDALAQTFEQPPETPEAARASLADFPWAIPGETVLSAVGGRLQERPLR
ncbi:transglutaminase domain-containing protein [Algihabitans albus]|uniref:transglutaminase domain-containing protein n=1 Tax=Algihabitans albus TaxID=2164067 RepID=UPI000E5D83F6|nr:transglutaminase domain-containing protein [Algihabitans albus]